MSKVEDAIRRWEGARAVEKGIREALDGSHLSRSEDYILRTVMTARVMEAFSKAILLMASADNDGSVGWMVDRRFYFRVGYDEIRSIIIANP